MLFIKNYFATPLCPIFYITLLLISLPLVGCVFPLLRVYYQVFGKALGTAPVVVVNHAFTGNSQVTGENGWWKEAIGEGKLIDTLKIHSSSF